MDRVDALLPLRPAHLVLAALRVPVARPRSSRLVAHVVLTREWFRAVYGIDEASVFAHSFATTWGSVDDGRARSACGQSPFDHVDGGMVRFERVTDPDSRCPKCVAALAIGDDEQKEAA